MKTIDVNKIIETQGLNVKEVAKELFPSNKYAKMALDRVLKGEAYLDTNQVSKLSLMTGVPIQFLYSGGEWETSSTDHVIKFSSGEYVAELDTKKWTTNVFHKGSIFHEKIIHKGSIPLSVYLEEITQLIIKNSKS